MGGRVRIVPTVEGFQHNPPARMRRYAGLPLTAARVRNRPSFSGHLTIARLGSSSLADRLPCSPQPSTRAGHPLSSRSLCGLALGPAR
jgi:hypothetical protein